MCLRAEVGEREGEVIEEGEEKANGSDGSNGSMYR